ncbi:hypothetical protein ABPG74_020018 [Tetrahymena malaccensis]
MATLSQLIYYFDFAKASSKGGYLYNLAPENQKCYKQNCIDKLDWPYYKYTSNSQFDSDRPINFQEENGLIFSFDIYVSTSDMNYYGGVFGLHAQNINGQTLPWVTLYQIIITNGNILDLYQDKNSNYFYSSQLPFTFDQQHQIVCILQKKFDQVIRQFYLDGVLIFNSAFLNTYWGQIGFSLYNFSENSPITTRIVQIKSFKLYSGGFFESCGNCNIYINNYDCFQCQNTSDYLKFDSQYNCQLSCSPPFLSSATSNFCLQDTSNSSLCTLVDQDLFDNQCRCPDGQYFDSDLSKCLNCLYYCRTCLTQYTCETFLYSNNYNVIKIEYKEYSNSLIMAQFNVVVNYISDEVEMEYPFQINPYIYNIIIGDMYTKYAILVLNNEPILYYSQIQIYLGGFYFISYDNQDPCFIYINRSNMTCIFPKQNYVLKNGKAISQNDCNKDNQNQDLYYYDENTKTCQNSGLKFPNCLNINIQTKQCSQCIDSNMILSQNCSCPNGMYFEQNLKACKYCSPSCSTCTTNENNCLTCKNQNQIPPLCYCIHSDQYIDSNFVCKQCNIQCSTCTGNPDYCLSCSQNRLNPPLCNIFTSNNCPSKCKYCNQNNQCIQCKENKISPPDCVCPNGQFNDHDTGLCKTCQPGYYYDQNKQTCQKCFELCASCFGKESFNCATCLFGLQLNKNNEQLLLLNNGDRIQHIIFKQLILAYN